MPYDPLTIQPQNLDQLSAWRRALNRHVNSGGPKPVDLDPAGPAAALMAECRGKYGDNNLPQIERVNSVVMTARRVSWKEAVTVPLADVLEALRGPAPAPASAAPVTTPPTPTQSLPEDLAAILGAVVDENAVEIVTIARDHNRSADERMDAIEKLDSRVVAWQSERWAEVLRNVTASAVRQTRWWKGHRKHREH